MRLVGLFIVLTSAVVLYCWGRPGGASAILKPSQTANVVSTDVKVDFATQVEPLLKARCEGCHFAGGKMYEKLPFDRPETIKKLGTKLFTRISDENDRKVIREFLAQD